MARKATRHVRRYVYYEEVTIEEPAGRPAEGLLGRARGQLLTSADRLALGAATALLPLCVARLAGEAARRGLPAAARRALPAFRDQQERRPLERV